MWDYSQEFVPDSCVCEEREPSFPSDRLIGRISFGNPLGRIEDAASKNIQEKSFLGGILMWNDATVYGGRMELKMFMRD